MSDAPRTPTGEMLYVCAVPTDTVRWCVEQLHPDGDGAVAAVCVAEEMLWATHFFTGADAPGQRLEHFGSSLDTRSSEMMQSQVIANAHGSSPSPSEVDGPDSALPDQRSVAFECPVPAKVSQATRAS